MPTAHMVTLILVAALFSIALAQDISSTVSSTMVTSSPVASPSSALSSSSSSSLNSSIVPSSFPTAPSSSVPSVSNTSFTPYSTPTGQNSGFDGSGNPLPKQDESWLKQHNRFVFIIVLGLLFLALLIWYIVKSVKGMRKRLERENEHHMMMMQQATGGRPDRIIPESPTIANTGNRDKLDSFHIDSSSAYSPPSPQSPPPRY
ncbi:uncharacterized protein BYT42DRAFT_333381 [Radiomyces spectabilis]|uniref:uncharacterized protein n=1 Tax=Radiomyces spectabilis TaxID=64574 RepID=UPI00221EFB19|nr:uncharacterized protein BYT42DRAFT_333381 [Radiomyces spectabilis]KAI8379615.1 hypothetical protein BYT42DRAFT_333381 [Radiomyces spectabilis]